MFTGIIEAVGVVREVDERESTRRFRVEAPEGIELPVSVARFREILSNLVRNAAQGCGATGRQARRPGAS